MSRSAAVALGLLGDRLFGEPPPHVHPVALYGNVMRAVESRLWRDDRDAGIAHAAVGIGLGAAAGSALSSTALATSLVVAGRELRSVASQVGRSIREADLEGARQAMPALVGRDVSELDAAGLSAAVIESVAENTVDAVVAPAFWALLGGAVGATAYRAINTLDSMVGHRSPRYERYGWASARADDVANWVPARLAAALVCMVRPRRAAAVWRALRDHSSRHPSPNAGVAEAAFAGALGVELGGTTRYGDRVEERPRLGYGPRPGPFDIGLAVRLSDDVELALVMTLLAWEAVR